MSSRCSEDNRAGTEMFALVPSALVKHDSVRNLEEGCNFGNRTYLHRPLFLQSLRNGNTFGVHPLYS